mgnify:CR=1 FL=1
MSMFGFNGFRLMRRFAGLKRGLGLCLSVGVLAFGGPTAALAQVQIDATDRNFLNDLYTFLQGQDEMSYQLAAGIIGDETNVWLAKGVCLDFDRGLSPADGYDLFVTAARSQMHTIPLEQQAQAAYSVDLYGGSLMNLGSAYYCPQYQPQVEAALRAL